MSVPQIFLTASGSATPVISSNNSRRLQSNDPSTVAKENIRERLNMHVKKRIQGQDIYPTSPPNPSHLYSHQFDRDSAAAHRPTHPFLMSGKLYTWLLFIECSGIASQKSFFFISF